MRHKVIRNVNNTTFAKYTIAFNSVDSFTAPQRGGVFQPCDD